MFSQTTTIFLILSSLAFANPIVSPTPVNVAKRQPSAYPYGAPIANEFQWENWDPNSDVDRADGEKIHEGFRQWPDLARAGQFAALESSDNEHFRRWFGTQDADDTVSIQNTFLNMWNETEGRATTIISTMVLDRLDFGNHCDKGWWAYTDPPTGRFHMCPKAFGLRQQEETTCDEFDQSEYIHYPSARTVSFVILHETTHYDNIADDRLGLIEDPGVSPSECFALDDEQKQTNANNYAFEAAEQYWANRCPDKTFQDPPPPPSPSPSEITDPPEDPLRV